MTALITPDAGVGGSFAGAHLDNGKRRGNGDGWLFLGATGPAIHALEKNAGLRVSHPPPTSYSRQLDCAQPRQDDETTFDGAQGRVMTARAYDCGHVKGDIKQRTTD